MQLSVHNISKHYNKQWLFRNISFNLNVGDSIAVLGKNGSGKSTMLQVIYGLIQASEGHVKIDNMEIMYPDKFFNITSPLLTLPLEFSMQELIQYHTNLSKINIEMADFLERASFSKKDAEKPLKYFSSGMLQRFKTSLCLFSNNVVKLLDEPLSNMDKEGEKWYINCIESIQQENILIVASNSNPEYQFINNNISL